MIDKLLPISLPASQAVAEAPLRRARTTCTHGQ